LVLDIYSFLEGKRFWVIIEGSAAVFFTAARVATTYEGDGEGNG